MTYPKEGTQPHKVLKALLDAQGEWVNGQVFLRELYLSQYHARIKDLEDKFGWKDVLEHSKFTDQWGYKSYRIRSQVPLPV